MLRHYLAPRLHQLPFNLLVTVSILLLPTPTWSVTLGDFTPRATNLTDACAAVYNSQISGCSNTDFTTGICSSTCISALVTLNTEVYTACSSSPQDDEMLIAAFLSGTGISSICPNVVVTTISGADVTVTSMPSSSLQTTTVTVTSLGSNAATTTAQVTEVPSSILVDTSSPPVVSAAQSTTKPKTTTMTTVETSTIKSTIIITESTSTTTSALVTDSASATASDLSTTSTIALATSVVTPTTTLLTSMSTTSVSAAGSSSSTTVASLASSTDCQHSGDPFQYCNSANSLLASGVLGVLPTAVILIWLASG